MELPAQGDAVDIAFDCHWRYNVSDAQRLAYELEPFGLMWLEDPVPPENVEAMRRVTRSTRTPIANIIRFCFITCSSSFGLKLPCSRLYVG